MISISLLLFYPRRYNDNINHVVRVDNPQSVYCEDPSSGRLSVVVPYFHLDSSSSCLMKFMCLGSDPGGPNRRPLQVVFTLEDQFKNILGRDLVNIKICCCPRRDRASEERRFLTNITVDNREDER